MLEESRIIEQNVDELSQKIFKNLEEFWEISTTLQELDQLNEQNFQELQNDQQDAQRLLELQETIQVNEKIKREMLENLKKNQSEKQALYQDLKQLGKRGALSQQRSGEHSLSGYQNLESELKYLKLEKINLCT